MSGREDRPRRPAPYPDLTARIDAAGGVLPDTALARAELAAATAAALVRAGRERADDAATGEVFVDLADRVGLDTLAELWRDSDPVSLPGSLWALYVLHRWCRTHTDDVVRLWRAGEPLAAADAAVAGVGLLGDATAIVSAADAIVAGVYRGDVAVALERAAALLRVLATGRRDLCVGPAELGRAERNERVAADLTAAARRWRAGTLR